jgi:two-component system sensor histidine kinase KdpD
MFGPARSSGWASAAVAAVIGLAISTALVALLEAALEIDNASAVFLVAVSAVAIFLGTWPAVATAAGAFLLYNFFFVDPRYTLTVSRPEELLTLVLLLFVGILISRLAGLQRQREQEAQRREREARALFSVSRELVQSERLGDAIAAVAHRLVEEAAMSRVWIGVGATVATERVAADSATPTGVPTAGAPSAVASHCVLHRDAAEGLAKWVRIRPPTGGATPAASPVDGRGQRRYRIELRAGGEVVGSLWAERDGKDLPQVEETRLLATAADQLGAAIRRDRLLAQAAELEIARRSDELKSAFVDSVSHDLRTPLSTIRAAAGSLADPAIDLPVDERRSIARAIDTEADRLNRLVSDLLDMSRIQGGALVPDLEIVPLDDLVRPAVDRASNGGRVRPIETRLPTDLPHVRVDAALLDRVLANLLDNALKHAGSEAPIRVTASRGDGETVALTVEDGGPGVPDESLGTIFERFSRLDPAVHARRGFGLGLTIVRGLTEAMGGSVAADRSELGGLSVTLRLPIAEPMAT